MAESTAQPAEDASKLVIHHLNDSRSQRILWLVVSMRQGLPDPFVTMDIVC